MTTRQVDVVIIGGGPAGISTALHLHAASPWIASRTVVLEKKTYPREKICAGAIGARAFRKLDALGVSLDVPMVRLDAFAVRMGGQTITVHEPGLGVVVRRIEFDHALAKVAIARGLEIRDGCGVETIAVTESGVDVTTDTGDRYHAKVLVGADGVGGVVRRQAGFPRGELRAQVLELDTPTVASDLPRDTLLFDFTARDLKGYGWDFPTIVDGRPEMCRGIYVIRPATGDGEPAGPEPQTQIRDRVATYLAQRGLALVDADGTDRYRVKHFAERGFEPGAPIAKPRVLLVGEAAGIDIATGEGIAQAIEYGAVAGPYLARAFGDGDLAFTDWRRRVDLDHVGWQLRIRHACFRAFYGRARPRLEQIVPRLTTLFRVGGRDFAGKPLSALDLVRGGAQLFAAMAREGLRPRSAR